MDGIGVQGVKSSHAEKDKHLLNILIHMWMAKHRGQRAAWKNTKHFEFTQQAGGGLDHFRQLLLPVSVSLRT